MKKRVTPLPGELPRSVFHHFIYILTELSFIPIFWNQGFFPFTAERKFIAVKLAVPFDPDQALNYPSAD